MSEQSVVVRLCVPVVLQPQDVRPYVEHAMASKGMEVTGIQINDYPGNEDSVGVFVRCRADDRTAAALLESKLGLSDVWSYDPSARINESRYSYIGSEPNWTDANMKTDWRKFVSSQRPDTWRSLVKECCYKLVLMAIAPFQIIALLIRDPALVPYGFHAFWLALAGFWSMPGEFVRASVLRRRIMRRIPAR